MKRLQNAKISKKSIKKKSDKDIISFVDENDRIAFREIISDYLKEKEFIEEVRKKQNKYKSSFKIKHVDNRLKEIGIEPLFVLKFKKVKNSDEWDLNIHLDKLKNVELSEYFD